MRILGAVLVLVGLIGFFAFRTEPKPDDAPAVLAQVQKLNQLATVRYTVQKVVGLREPKYPVGEESILLVVQARVEAGVDLVNLTAPDVSVDRDAVTVRLPPARILNISIDEKETKVWDRAKTWWTPWVPFSKELEGKARQQGLEAAKQAALEMGILKQAQRNAEDSIRALLQLSGGRRVEVIPSGVS